ncbi:MAG: FmdB family zinc ribbon protein [bacterium]
MPTYEYECTTCKHRFTQFQNMNDDPVKTCSRCAGSVRRLITGGTGFLFKGSHSYASDSQFRERGSDTCCSRGNICSDPKRCCGK